MTRRVLLGMLTLPLAACSGNQSMFNPQGPAARDIADLGLLLLGVSVVVYVVVMAVLGWALMRTRQTADDSPQTTRRLGIVITVAVALTAFILVALTGASAAAGHGITTATEDSRSITVDVIGHQWWWDFQYHYPTSSDLVTSSNELHIPIGVPVVIVAQSRDVIHRFWVPNLHGKRDLIPGQVTRVWIQADSAGIYRGQCAEFCGHQHATMAFRVVAEPREAFETWLGNQRAPASEPATDAQRRGQEVFLRSPCVTCHAIEGTQAGSHIGPDLTHVGSRLTLAAGTLPNTLEHLRNWVQDAPAIRPGVRMPQQALSAEDLDALLSYLRSLQ